MSKDGEAIVCVFFFFNEVVVNGLYTLSLFVFSQFKRL